MTNYDRLDDLIMAYAKAADGIGCERGSFLYEEIKRGLSAVLLRMQLWSPMDNAPKDGREIVLYVPDDDDGDVYKIGRWHGDEMPRPGWFFRGGWICEDGPLAWCELLPPPYTDQASTS